MVAPMYDTGPHPSRGSRVIEALPVTTPARLALITALLGCSSSPAVPPDASVSSDIVNAAVDIPAVDGSSVMSDVPSITETSLVIDDVPVPACGVCAVRPEPETSGFLTDNALDELSGIVESRAQPGIFFVHNDSGDSARFFAIDRGGALRATFVLRGVTAVDWEDIAIGPCPAGTCLYLGDIGDNDGVRPGYALYRVAQPTVADGTVADRELPWERFSFTYPDGRHNSEALAIRPDTGDVYVFTKVTTLPSVIYRFPQPLRVDASMTLTRVGELALPAGSSGLVTGADIHPCAPRLLVRTYDRLWEFSGAGASWEDLFRATPQRMLVQTENQGEAVGWHSNGRGYATISEGRAQGLHDALCPR